MATKERKRGPYTRIMQAAKGGSGCYLTADDCRRLAQDGAIETMAGYERGIKLRIDPMCPDIPGLIDAQPETAGGGDGCI